MRRIIFAVATTVAVFALPAAAMAEEGGSSGAPSATDMKGSPNANGYGKDKGTAAGTDAERQGGSDKPSGTDMKGPPNANGYSK